MFLLTWKFEEKGKTFLFVEDTPCYQHLHHLVGSLQYLIDSNVPEELLYWVVFQIPVASVHLECLVHNLRD